VLLRLSAHLSEPTNQTALCEAGFAPRFDDPFKLERYGPTAKDLIWAPDFFLVRTANFYARGYYVPLPPQSESPDV
jgi:hypothetical protein